MKPLASRNGVAVEAKPRRQDVGALIAVLAADPDGRARLEELRTALLALREALATPGVSDLVGLDPAAVEELLLAVEAALRVEAIRPAPGGGVVQGLPGGSRGSGGLWIEWKHIRGPNGRLYGPYPYLRWREGKKKRSRYLKGGGG